MSFSAAHCAVGLRALCVDRELHSDATLQGFGRRKGRLWHRKLATFFARHVERSHRFGFCGGDYPRISGFPPDSGLIGDRHPHLEPVCGTRRDCDANDRQVGPQVFSEQDVSERRRSSARDCGDNTCDSAEFDLPAKHLHGGSSSHGCIPTPWCPSVGRASSPAGCRFPTGGNHGG